MAPGGERNGAVYREPHRTASFHWPFFRRKVRPHSATHAHSLEMTAVNQTALSLNPTTGVYLRLLCDESVGNILRQHGIEPAP